MCNRKVIIRLWVILFTVLLSPTPYAAQECRFGDGSTYNETISGATLDTGSIQWLPRSSVAQYALVATAHTATLSPTLKSNCSMGNDGRSMWGAANAATRYSSITYGGDKMSLFPTNVPGIYYSVALITTNNDGRVFIPANTNVAKLNDMSDPTLDGTTWKAQIYVFQSSSFTGNSGGATTLTPNISAGTLLGTMGLGDYRDSNNKQSNFSVSASSFAFTIKPATCQAMVMSGGDSANTVNFGDLNLTDVQSGTLPTRDFGISLTGCSNVYRIIPTVTATTTLTSGSTTLLENELKSNAASGIGVQLLISNQAQGSGWSEIVNKGAPTTYTYTYVQSTDDDSSYIANFRATLMKDGKTIKAGAFQSTATITMSYQ